MMMLGTMLGCAVLCPPSLSTSADNTHVIHHACLHHESEVRHAGLICPLCEFYNFLMPTPTTSILPTPEPPP